MKAPTPSGQVGLSLPAPVGPWIYGALGDGLRSGHVCPSEPGLWGCGVNRLSSHSLPFPWPPALVISFSLEQEEGRSTHRSGRRPSRGGSTEHSLGNLGPLSASFPLLAADPRLGARWPGVSAPWLASRTRRSGDPGAWFYAALSLLSCRDLGWGPLGTASPLSPTNLCTNSLLLPLLRVVNSMGPLGGKRVGSVPTPGGGAAALYVCLVLPWPYHRCLHMPAQASACAHRERAATACLQLSHGFPSVEKLLSAKPCWLGKGLLSLAGEEGQGL